MALMRPHSQHLSVSKARSLEVYHCSQIRAPVGPAWGRTRAGYVQASRNGPGAQLDGDQYQQLLAVQRHILQVDAARAKAVADVELYSGQLVEERAAREKAEQEALNLRAELAAATARVSDLEAQLSGLVPLQAAVATGQSAAAPTTQQQQPSQSQAAAAGVTVAPPAAGAPAPPGTIVLQYFSAWPEVFIHFEADKKGWTQNPGVRMAVGPEPNQKVVAIAASRLEFVMNNGRGDWDSPGRYSDNPSNYHITSPGMYKLRSGRLERLSV